MNSNSDKINFAYWGIQGLGQPIRYLLEYLELSYDDKQYNDEQKWIEDKESLAFDFPNLPYLNVGNFWLTESNAILQYVPSLAGNSDLNGKNSNDRAIVQNILGVLSDVNGVIRPTYYLPIDDLKKFKDEKFAGVEPKLKYLNKYLGNKDYLLGYITVADFLLFYILDSINAFDAKYLKNHQGLVDFHRKFKEIKQIKKYQESGRVPKNYNGPYAGWPGEFKI